GVVPAPSPRTWRAPDSGGAGHRTEISAKQRTSYESASWLFLSSLTHRILPPSGSVYQRGKPSGGREPSPARPNAPGEAAAQVFLVLSQETPLSPGARSRFGT